MVGRSLCPQGPPMTHPSTSSLPCSSTWSGCHLQMAPLDPSAGPPLGAASQSLQTGGPVPGRPRWEWRPGVAEGRGGQRKHQSRGEAEERPTKSKARDPSRATDFTRRDEVQLKSDHKGSSGRAGGGRGEGCVWGRTPPEQACRALTSTLHRAHAAEHHKAVLSWPC